MSNCVDIDLDKSLIVQIYDLQQENQELKEKINGVYEERTYLYNKLSAEKEQLNSSDYALLKIGEFILSYKKIENIEKIEMLCI